MFTNRLYQYKTKVDKRSYNHR